MKEKMNYYFLIIFQLFQNLLFQKLFQKIMNDEKVSKNEMCS